MNALTIQESLQIAAQALSKISDHPLFEAELLLAHALAKPRSYLHAWPEQMISIESAHRFSAYQKRRLQKEPIAYITGKREFWSLTLTVTQDTLVPRPETELLVDMILKLFPDPNESRKIADLGTGSGAIALALASERPLWRIYATDLSAQALVIAQKNARDLLPHSAKPTHDFKPITFCQGHWCEALPEKDFDVIVSNPPYIAETEWADYQAGLAFEPKHALVSGKEGLDALTEISQVAKHYLKPGGYLLVEHGFSQGAAVRELFGAHGYQSLISTKDLSGMERITSGHVAVDIKSRGTC